MFALQDGASFGGVSMTLGENATGVGALQLTGAGSSASFSQDLTVGKNGTGSISLADSSALTDQGDVTLGSQAGSQGSATLAGKSSWQIAGALSVGGKGQGTVTVQTGSVLLVAGATDIGKSGAAGLLTVNGAGNAAGSTNFRYGGDLIIGKASDGQLNITNGGLVEATSGGSGAVFLAETSGVTGALNINNAGSELDATALTLGGSSSAAGGTATAALASGGYLNVSSKIKLYGGSTLDVTGGTANVGTTGGAITTGTLAVNKDGTLTGAGTIKGNVDNIAGTVTPGGSNPGTLTINGSYLQSGGALDILLKGAGTGQFSQLDSTGTVALTGGQVIFNFAGGYLPVKGDSVAFLDPPSGVTLQNVQYSYTGAAPGFLFNVNSNSNGLVFTALNNAVAPIPEPATLGLLAVGCLALVKRRRRA